jgi:hypothetical protein
MVNFQEMLPFETIRARYFIETSADNQCQLIPEAIDAQNRKESGISRKGRFLTPGTSTTLARCPLGKSP